MNAPTLFDVAAEQEAIATGKPLSQTRLELEHSTPEPLPADGLFRAGHTTWGHNAQGRFVVKREG